MSHKVALIGVYPPPVGGISIHIKRLSDTLDERRISYQIYDNTEGSKDKPVTYIEPIEKWCLKYFFTAKESIIHCHFLRWQVRFLLSLLRLRGKRIVFTFHSYRPEEAAGFLKKMMIRVTGKLGNSFICVTQQIADDLIKEGIPAHKIKVIPAFIAPKLDAGIGLPENVEEWISGAQPLLVANGTIGVTYKGEDLYGADICIELVRRLVPTYPQLKFLFCITFTKNEDYRAELERRIDEYGLRDHFRFVEAIEFHALVARADLMLRTTNTDGDAISIRESIYFGTPVLASDVTERPKGVELFQNRNVDDLVQKAIAILSDQKPIDLHRRDFADDVLNEYQIS